MKDKIYLDLNIGDILENRKIIGYTVDQPHIVFELEDGTKISKRGMSKIYES